MLSLVELISAKLLLDLYELHTVTHKVYPNKSILNLHQSYTITCRVHLSQTIARSTSAI